MRAHVLTDARLAKLAGRFVWLGIDTEKPGNAAFVERFPIDAWPSILVVDPATEQVVLRWAGTATAEQIERLALDGERALRARGLGRADAALARADRLLGERKHAEAAAAFREAIAAGGPSWSGRGRAAEAAVQALGMAGDPAACAEAARELLPLTSPGSSRARVAGQGLACALELEGQGAPHPLVAALEPEARRALAAKGVLADDRSWLYDVLSEAREAAGDDAGRRRLAGEWLSFLEREAARARTPAARSAYDGQRVSAALRLGEPARALPAIEASMRELPDDYAPPTLAGVLYLELDRDADALAAADRALALAKGPRRVRVLVLKAQAQQGLGDAAAARATLEQAVREGEALPEAARPQGHLRKARKLLSELGQS
jgi:tetratricopeptide (TPR) repeat protein